MSSGTEGWGSPSFTTPDSFALMWDYSRYFVSAYMPYIMIVVAIFITWAIASIVIYIVSPKKKDDDNDDDEVEFL